MYGRFQILLVTEAVFTPSLPQLGLIVVKKYTLDAIFFLYVLPVKCV